jgi:amidase
VIPSHGIVGIDHTIDFACAIARSLELVARTTDVISGHDWRDAQWVRSTPVPTACAAQLGRGVEGMRIAVLEESVDETLCEPGVLEGFERARQALVDGGANVTTVSVPLWADAWAIEVALLCILGWATTQSEGVGFGNLGFVDTDRAHAFALARRLEANEFPPFLKVWLLVGRYMHDHYYGTYLGKAQNLRLALRHQVDEALEHCDLLITPTTPHSAPLLAEGAVGDFELLKKATTMTANVAPLNLTGHPALAVPAGLDEQSLPVSAQVIGRQFDDATTFRAGAVIEEALGVPEADALKAV